MKIFAIGDIHGRYKALMEVLKKSKFNYKKDKLICLGDIVDGGLDTYKCVEELLKIKNLIFCLGNHDYWFIKHIESGFREEIWLQQGGCNTLTSYGAICKEAEYLSEESFVDTSNLVIPVTHKYFFNRGRYYYVFNDMLFVHGGINPKIPYLKSQSKHDLLWDRNLIQYCRRGNNVPGYKKVFIGHTNTHKWSDYLPIRFNNLYLLDTGAGFNGKLTIMNVETEEYWQSKIQIGGR